MKNHIRILTVFVVLFLSAMPGFAVDVKVTAPDLKATAKTGSENVKADTKSTLNSGKENIKGAAKAKVVDINTATETELKAISGIGDAYAAKIIAGRPYANKAQLKSRKVLPGVLYEQVKDQLIAKQPRK